MLGFVLHGVALLAMAQSEAPVIDGKLEDAYWRKLPVQRLEPDGGEFRAVVRGRYLLLAARLPEPSGRVTARMTGRHPNWEDEDLLEVTEGPAIGYTDRVVRINPFGAFTTAREGQEVYANDHRYLIATHVGEREWTVEAAFPLNLTSAPDAETMLLSVKRIRAMRFNAPQQRWRWPKMDPVARVAVDREAGWDAVAPLYRPEVLGNHGDVLQVGRTSSRVWSLRRNEPGSPEARYGTEVNALHDGKTLTVLARMEEPDVAGKGDSFHLYFGASGSSWAQISVNAGGDLSDVAGKTGGPRISRPRDDWESGAKVAVRQEKGYWMARVDVPLAAVLNILGEPETQTKFRVLLVRVRPGRKGELTETSVSTPMSGWTMLAPIRYQPVELVDGAGSVSQPAVAAVPPLQTRVSPDPSMIYRHQRARAIAELEKQAKAWAGVSTREQWEQFRDERIGALRRFLGEFPARTDLRAQVGKEYVGKGYRRLDVVYQSRPGLWIAANLYLPETVRGRVPAVIVVPSHHRPRWQMELQDMGILWARAGSAVLIADNLGHGERIQTYPWNREGYHARYNLGLQLYVAGESLMKWMVWDVMRSVDFLESRAEVDAKRIVLLGAVAGGGDPAAVAAAMDPRVAAVAPFCYAEATPEHGGRGPWPEGLADPGWGSWESTRNLPRSIVDQFSPWVIAASVAPRHFIWSFEMGWEVEKQPAWARFQKVFGFYGAVDRLDEAHGFGGFPGPGECANIGPSQRKTLYPELERWFGIGAPKEEPDDRRPESELTADDARLTLRTANRPVHELAAEIGRERLRKARAVLAGLDVAGRRAWLQREWARRLGDVSVGAWRVSGNVVESEAGIHVPFVLLPGEKVDGRRPVVIAVSHAGKEGLWRTRHAEIQALVRAGVSVCLVDVRGTGETLTDRRRGPSSTEVALGATELMLGGSLLGARVKDVRAVLAYLRTRPDVDASRIAIWGDSEAAVNQGRIRVDETPGWQIGPDVQYEADPMGGLVALFAALYEPQVRAVAARRTLVSYESLLADTFAYVPGHVVAPDLLSAGDVEDVIAALAAKVRMEEPVDGRNRLVESERPKGSLVEWLRAQLGVRE
ncbi:MAG: acetylxylan esterase [Acidobacteria bacterium]|nr:acetylxylan esterase [Acidobacteriota bacterium]